MPASLTLVLLLGLGGVATAAPRRWAIGEIRIEGDLDGVERATTEERTWRALSLALPTDALLAPYEAVAGALTTTPGLRGCADDRCNLALGDRLGVERLLTVRIERRGDGWTAHLLSFAVDAAQVAGTLELPCPRCSDDALMDAFARAATPLLRDERPRPLCTLTVAAPAGAAIRVDTVLLGEAPFAHTVAAGRHTVAAAGAQAEIDCPAGAARAVRLLHDDGATRRRWQLGLGAAAAVLTAGSVAGLVSAADYQDRAACAGRCPYRFDATAGIALGAVGVIAFGAASVVLFATARRPSARGPGRETAGPAARATVDSATTLEPEATAAAGPSSAAAAKTDDVTRAAATRNSAQAATLEGARAAVAPRGVGASDSRDVSDATRGSTTATAARPAPAVSLLPATRAPFDRTVGGESAEPL